MQKYTLKKTKPKLPPVKIAQTVDRVRNGVKKVHGKMVPPHVALLELVSGMWIAQSVAVAAKLGLADHIGSATVTAGELAKKVGANEEALYRLMRALTVVDIFVEESNKSFRLASIGHCLRSDHPQSMRYVAMFQGQINWPSWGALDYSIQTGKSAAEHVLGEKPFDHLAKHKDKAMIFDQAMTNITEMEVDALIAGYDFSRFETIADIGGGHGFLLSSILALNPKQKGILFDLPYVIAETNEILKDIETGNRIKTVEGSFFEGVPAGADAYMMKHILHDWSDNECNEILKNIRKQMKPGAKLLILDAVLPGANVPHFSKFLDLEMLVVTTGKERTADEFEALLAKSGFKLDRIVPTLSLSSVIEASPGDHT